jgi:glycine dehydrogenase subunit 2
MAMLKHPEKVIFEYSRPGRGAFGQWPTERGTPNETAADIPESLRRKKAPMLPELSELEVVRHFTRLSQLNFSIDTHFYPLGSCTMKYNPKACNSFAMLPGFLNRHPLAPESLGQGFSPACSSCRRCSRKSRACRGSRSRPWRARTASSPVWP